MMIHIYVIHQTSLQHSKKETEMGKMHGMHRVMRNEYNISIGKHEGKTICGQLRHRWEENNKK